MQGRRVTIFVEYDERMKRRTGSTQIARKTKMKKNHKKKKKKKQEEEEEETINITSSL